MGRIKRYYSALSRYHASNGFGIHSPFAFYFVTKVLREKLPYYCYDEIEKNRKQLINSLKKVARHPRIISSKNAKLLFRVTNYFNPNYILQIGSNYGISLQTMLRVSQCSEVYLYDRDLSRYEVTKKILINNKERITLSEDVETLINSYTKVLTENSMSSFVLINSIEQEEFELVSKYLQSIISQEGVVIMRNLSSSALMRELWNKGKENAYYGMTFSNEKVGFMVVNPKLPRQDFLLWF